jgi:MoaA/NifB/PqqE/SkfB family radical SAM enzyme
MSLALSNTEAAGNALHERRLNPFLEWDPKRILNPQTNVSVLEGQPEWEALQALRSGAGSTPLEGALLQSLASGGWLVGANEDLSSKYLLRFVSLETATKCNQKCYFCPVSVDPREDEEMSEAMFDSILGQLAAHRSTIEGVFLQSYNEPTVERRFVQHCHKLMDAKFPVAVLTNASGLSPKRVDEILTKGPLRYLGVNISTLDRQRYLADRGADHLDVVLKNLDYIASRPLAEEMVLVVLGKDDATHDFDHASILERFAGTPFKIQRFSVMDRAGYLDLGLSTDLRTRRLAGCDNMGSRPIQHLHITPSGNCVLCCQDYDEAYVVGNLHRESIHEVLSGPEMSKFRRMAYGIEKAPDNFICNNCIFAKTAD